MKKRERANSKRKRERERANSKRKRERERLVRVREWLSLITFPVPARR